MILQNRTRQRRRRSVRGLIWLGRVRRAGGAPVLLYYGEFQFNFFSVQLEELLEPYLKDTDLGLPYWDWTKNATIPDLWEDVFSPIKEFNNTDFDGPLRFADLSQCQSQFPGYFLKNNIF